MVSKESLENKIKNIQRLYKENKHNKEIIALQLSGEIRPERKIFNKKS